MNFKKYLHNKTLQNSFFTLALRMAGVATLFGLSTLMTRNIEATYVGSYEFARVTLLTIATFGLLGTEQSVLYFSGKLDAQAQTKQLQSIYFKMLKVVWIASILVGLLYLIVPTPWLVSLGVKSSLLNVLKKCMMILPFYTTTILNTETIRAYNNILISEWFRNIFKYIPIVLGTILIVYNLVPVDTLLNWYLYGFIFLAIVTFIVLQRHLLKEHALRLGTVSTRDIVKTSYPMAISSFCTYLLMTVDVFLLAQFFNLEYTAYYAIAMKIMSILSMVIIGVNINYAPKIAVYFEKKDFISLKISLKEAAKTIALINVIVGFILLMGGRFFLSLFGESYVEALPAYNILITTQITVSLFGMVPMYMNMTGKQRIFHKIMAAAVVVNIFCNIFLIPKYHMVGAAVGYAVTVLFWNIMVVYFSYKNDKVILSLWK